MSVFGGDSWAREAQHRKRRVDDLVVEGLHGSSYKKLSSGKYCCLVCPNNPVLDTALMLSMHIKGSRHRVAESKVKERPLAIQDEMNKRIALSECATGTSVNGMSTQVPEHSRLARKPLLEQTRRATSEILGNFTPRQDSAKRMKNVTLERGYNFTRQSSQSNSMGTVFTIEAAGKTLEQQQLDIHKRRERELKFTAAGWKRDCHGRWFKDEKVEFDSDEEDPNLCLA